MKIDLQNLNWKKIFEELGNVLFLTITGGLVFVIILLVIAAICAMSEGAKIFFGVMFGFGFVFALIARFVFGVTIHD